MALRLRRGTDAERLTITPDDGEMIWTTDTQELYVGDGSTVGGIRITGALNDSPSILTRNLDLGSYTIFGAGNISINGQIGTTGSITATGGVSALSFTGDGSGLTNLSAANLDVSDLVVEGGTYNINIVGPDSADVLNTETSVLTIDDILSSTLVTETITANQVYADLIGEVNTEDSTIVIDRNGAIYTNTINSPSNNLSIDAVIENNANNIFLNATNNDNDIIFNRRQSGSLSGEVLGKLDFRHTDIDTGTPTDYARIAVGQGSMAIVHGSDGSLDFDKYFLIANGLFALGGAPESTNKLTVRGDTYAAGNVNATGILSAGDRLNLTSQVTLDVTSPADGDMIWDGSPAARTPLFYDGSVWRFPIMVDVGQVYLPNQLPLQAANYSTAVINAGLSGAQENGVLLYNTTEEEIQVYSKGAWRNIAAEGGVFKGDIQGSVTLDDSTTVIEGDTGKITAPNTVTFVSLSTAERDALGVVAGGTVVFNSSTAKLQVFNGSTWVDLH